MSKNIKITTKKSKTNSKKSQTKPIKKILDEDLDEDLNIQSSSPKIKTTKKNITNNNSSNDNNNNNDFDNKIESIKEELQKNYVQQKKLMNDLKELIILHKKEIKLTTKIGNRANSGKLSGFNKPEAVPPSLKKLLKIKEDALPRSTVTKLMYKYFTDNKMYNSKTKKEIIPNAKIKEIFNMNDDDVINFYNLQTWLKKVYNENTTTNVLKIED